MNKENEKLQKVIKKEIKIENIRCKMKSKT